MISSPAEGITAGAVLGASVLAMGAATADLAAGAVAKAKNDKGAAGAVFAEIQLDKEKWRLGHTKVFFRAGILGSMEEFREDKIGSVLSLLQAQARGKASRLVFKKMQDQKLAL